MYTIAADAMGGDFAPDAPVQGALRALNEFNDISITLVGRQEDIARSARGARNPRLTIVDARETIGNDESPVMALRKKKDSSLSRAFDLLRDGQARALISAGSTGAVMAGSMFRLGRIPGVDRPAITVLVPTPSGKPVVMLDAGANVDCPPATLAQFAVMGAVYARALLGREKPRVGLVNIGEEPEKGSQQTKAAYQLLSQPNPVYEFVGNVESRGIPMGEVDVAVCDGFTGNVIMKAMEGVSKSLFEMIRKELNASLRSKIGGALAMPALRRLKGVMSAEEVGGALMLGASGLVVKAHGNSREYAFFAGLRQARSLLMADVVSRIQAALPA
ncbi:MAG: phosphate acyltransferase PlsX [Oscillospiraceae bacterium]|jgi:glycerol-3-phosphate acyltransferase PlsX|nr:phosphate acyltransferase PlsX [Oscillospiraceae bacterium]